MKPLNRIEHVRMILMGLVVFLVLSSVSHAELITWKASFEDGWDGFQHAPQIVRAKGKAASGQYAIKLPYKNANGKTLYKSIGEVSSKTVRADFYVMAQGDGNGEAAFGLTGEVSWKKLQVEIKVKGTGDAKKPTYKIIYNDGGRWKDAITEIAGGTWLHIRLIARPGTTDSGRYDLYISNMETAVATDVEFRYDKTGHMKYFYAECFYNKGTGSYMYLDDVTISPGLGE